MFKKLAFAFFAALLALMPLLGTAQAFGATPDWQAIQADATIISSQALVLEQMAAEAKQEALTIQATETDADVLAAATSIIDLAAQVEQDAAAIAVTADDINTRIDNSEGTTLQLSQDIGEMADRIGEMADRILLTEEQIGIMADRIVTSENLISADTLALAAQIQTNNESMEAITLDIIAHNNHIQTLLVA